MLRPGFPDFIRCDIAAEFIAERCGRHVVAKDCHGFVATSERVCEPFGELLGSGGEVDQCTLQPVSNRIEHRNAFFAEVNIVGNEEFTAQRVPSAGQAYDC